MICYGIIKIDGCLILVVFESNFILWKGILKWNEKMKLKEIFNWNWKLIYIGNFFLMNMLKN